MVTKSGLKVLVATALLLLSCSVPLLCHAASGMSPDVKKGKKQIVAEPVASGITIEGMTQNNKGTFVEPNVVLRGRTFHGQITSSFPMAFIDCLFVNDGKPVLKSTEGAVFLNCCFRIDGEGDLYVTERGDNIVMVDCSLIGFDGFQWSETIRKSDRNYVSGLTLNGRELSLDSLDCTIDMDGLDMVNSYRVVTKGDTLYQIPGSVNTARISASDYRIASKGESVKLMVEGLSDNMFVGWWTDDEQISLVPGPEPMACLAILEDDARLVHDASVNVVTEYGLELSVTLQVGNMPEAMDDGGHKLSARQIRRNNRKAKRQ